MVSLGLDQGPAGNAATCRSCQRFATTAVAALKAAGALMPDDAQRQKEYAEAFEMLTPQGCAAKKHPEWLIDSEDTYRCPWCALDKQAALLQEALSVLGPLLDVPYGSHQGYLEGPTRIGEEAHNRACDRLNEYKALQARTASLAEKIQKATGGGG